MTCVPYKYDKNLNQEYDMGIAGMGAAKWSKLYMQAPLGATSGSNTGINNVRMRFADVLLMYAEAVNELYGPRDDAQEALKFFNSYVTAANSYSPAITTMYSPTAKIKGRCLCSRAHQ